MTGKKDRRDRGWFFSFEGIDGCGKSTQIRLLTEYLSARNYDVVSVREPGGCTISEQVRAILLSNRNGQMCTNTEHLLYWAARAQILSEIIVPALKAGKAVIADRFGWSTYAYQGYGRGIPLEQIHFLRNTVCGAAWPDHSFFLDISLECMKKRLSTGREKPDRMESQKDTFFTRVREGYLTLIKENATAFSLIDGDLPIEIIQDTIQKKFVFLAESIPPQNG